MDYSFIVDYLYQTVGPSIQDLGERDARVSKYNEMVIAESFRRYVCGVEGDSGNGFFKADPIGVIYVFNGRFFEMLTETKFLGLIRDVLRKCNVGIVYLMDSADRVAKYCRESLMQEKRCQFCPDRRYVCFNNCVFDIVTRRILPHDYKFCTDIILNFEYKRDAKSALWDKILMQTVPDQGMRTALKQFCGAFLLNREKHKFEYICFLVGEGQNGKSIVCKAVVNMFRNEDETGQPVTNCVTAFTPDQLFRSQQQLYIMAEVNGKVMNYCDDVSDKDFSGGDFKQFVSGATVWGRSPYSKEMTRVTRVPLMLCCANRIPPTMDDSDGYFRRFLIINCPNKVSERDKDPQLEAKLAADDVRAAIFNWIVEGYEELMERDCKIEMSDSVLEMKDRMKADSNSARRWVRDEGVTVGTETHQWKSFKELMSEYQQYCRDYGEQAKTGKSVAKMLDEMGIPRSRRSDGVWYCVRYERVQDDLIGDLNDDDESVAMAKIPF